MSVLTGAKAMTARAQSSDDPFHVDVAPFIVNLDLVASSIMKAESHVKVSVESWVATRADGTYMRAQKPFEMTSPEQAETYGFAKSLLGKGGFPAPGDELQFNGGRHTVAPPWRLLDQQWLRCECI